MKLFVTGGAGYIGSATTALLLEAGHEVTVYDSLVKGYRQAIPSGAHFIQGDVGDEASLMAALQCDNYDAVMHFAAFIEAGESMKDPGRFFREQFHQHADPFGLYEQSRDTKAGILIHRRDLRIK